MRGRKSEKPTLHFKRGGGRNRTRDEDDDRLALISPHMYTSLSHVTLYITLPMHPRKHRFQQGDVRSFLEIARHTSIVVKRRVCFERIVALRLALIFTVTYLRRVSVASSTTDVAYLWIGG